MTGQTDNEHGGAGDLRRIDEAMEGLAAATGAVLQQYPRPGQPVRQVILRDHRDDDGSQVEEAVLEADGSLRVSGHDQGPRVARVFGPEVASYEWVYVIPAARVSMLVELLGGQEGDDVLALVAVHHEQHGRQLAPLLRRPEVGAEFSNWHS